MGLKKCEECDGSGAAVKEDKAGHREVCSWCGGSGRVSSGKQKEAL